jgi:AraC-like DNA-binding protein
MDSPVRPEWWPSHQLRRHPLKQVFVCGRRLNPPVYSHVVNFPRLELPVSGVYENEIEIADRIERVRLRPGMALFAAPECWNLPEWKPGLELLSIHFGRTQLGISLVSARFRSYPEVDAKKFSTPRPLTGPVPHILNALNELQAANGPIAAMLELSRGLLHCVEDLLKQPATQPASHALKLLEDIRVFLQSHYQYEITRDSVAQQFAISPNHLSRLFQTHGRMTFSGYLTQVRIERAKHLLRNYNLKLDDIAARCGYNDTPYFCHVFKNLTKQTPREYRLKSLQTAPKSEGPPDKLPEAAG